MRNRFPPWWTLFAICPPLLLLAGLLSDWYGIVTRLLYLVHYGKWETPSEGCITFIDKDQRKTVAEDAIGYNRDGVITWTGPSMRQRELALNMGKYE